MNTQWQPIETAPKDGTKYLATNGVHTTDCSWDDMSWADREPCVFPLKDATHWMPLPPPPMKDKDNE